MDIEYIENRIKAELLNKPFEAWNYNTIDFLIYIYDFEQYNQYYNMNLLLLEDYINWYQEQSSEISNKTYSLEKLLDLKNEIKKNLNVSNYYKNFLNNNKEKIYNTIFDNIYFLFIIIVMIIFLIVKSFLSCIFIEKKNAPQIMDNINPKSLIKLLLDNISI
jgi:hypothetical protein